MLPHTLDSIHTDSIRSVPVRSPNQHANEPLLFINCCLLEHIVVELNYKNFLSGNGQLQFSFGYGPVKSAVVRYHTEESEALSVDLVKKKVDNIAVNLWDTVIKV